MDELIRPLCEIGVDRIIPVLSEHTEKRWRSESQMHEKIERWRRLSIEAAKQSGNLRLPSIDAPASLKEALGAYNGGLLVASLEDDAQVLGSLSLESQSYAFCVGPEGDWSPSEYALLRAKGARPIRLADYVLRAETAAIYAMSVLDYCLASGKPGAKAEAQ
jgi:16S rRNA (uracil1498-N3)-methyltransferase